MLSSNQSRKTSFGSLRDLAATSATTINPSHNEFPPPPHDKLGQRRHRSIGEEETVPPVAERDVNMSPRGAARRGTKIANAVLAAPGFATLEVLLAAGADVAQAGVFGRVEAAICCRAWARSAGVHRSRRRRTIARAAHFIAASDDSSSAASCEPRRGKPAAKR